MVNRTELDLLLWHFLEQRRNYTKHDNDGRFSVWNTIYVVVIVGIFFGFVFFSLMTENFSENINTEVLGYYEYSKNLQKKGFFTKTRQIPSLVIENRAISSISKTTVEENSSTVTSTRTLEELSITQARKGAVIFDHWLPCSVVTIDVRNEISASSQAHPC